MNSLDLWLARSVLVIQYAAALAALAIPLSLSLRVNKFLNFHLASTYIAGGYLAYVGSKLSTDVALAFSFSVLAASIVGGSLSVLLLMLNENIGIETAPADAHLVFSLFLFLAVQALAVAVFGPRTLLAATAEQAGAETLGVARWAVVSFVILGLGCLKLLRNTLFGLRWVAAADNPSLAADQGIPVTRLRRQTAMAAGAATAFAGCLQAWDTGVQPYSNLFLNAVFGLLAGGAFSPLGAAAGCLILATVRQTSFGLNVYRGEEVLIALCLICILVVRPRGLFPTKSRTGDLISE